MTLKLDVLNFEYDDAEPAFQDLGIFYYHFPSRKLLEKTSFAAYLAASGKSFGTNELGTASAAFLSQHRSIVSDVGAITPAPTVAPPVAPPVPPPAAVVKPAADSSSGWTGAGAEPTMTTGQIGLWVDVAAGIGSTTFPMTLAAQKTVNVALTNAAGVATTESFVLPAKTYPDAAATDGGSASAANGLGWQLYYAVQAGSPTDIQGFNVVVDGNKLLLRADTIATGNTWATGISVA